MISLNYNYEYAPQKILELDKLSNIYIEAINEDDGFYYYLSLEVDGGIAKIVDYGPVILDSFKLPDMCCINYKKEKINDKKLSLFILKWLNDNKKKISSAKLVEKNIFIDNYPNLI